MTEGHELLHSELLHDPPSQSVVVRRSAIHPVPKPALVLEIQTQIFLQHRPGSSFRLPLVSLSLPCCCSHLQDQDDFVFGKKCFQCMCPLAAGLVESAVSVLPKQNVQAIEGGEELGDMVIGSAMTIRTV